MQTVRSIRLSLTTIKSYQNNDEKALNSLNSGLFLTISIISMLVLFRIYTVVLVLFLIDSTLYDLLLIESAPIDKNTGNVSGNLMLCSEPPSEGDFSQP